MAKLSKFGAAFAAARKAGKQEFTFGGKKYHTRTKEDMSVSAKDAPTPKARPSAKSGASRSTAGKASPKSGAARSTAGKVQPKAAVSGASRSTAGKVSPKSGAARSTAGKVQPKTKYQETKTPTGIKLLNRKTYRRY